MKIHEIYRYFPFLMTRRVVMVYPYGPHRAHYPITRVPTTPYTARVTHATRVPTVVSAATTSSPGSFWFQHVGHVTRSSRNWS